MFQAALRLIMYSVVLGYPSRGIMVGVAYSSLL